MVNQISAQMHPSQAQAASGPAQLQRLSGILQCTPSNDRVPARTEEPFRAAKGSLAPQGAIFAGMAAY